MSLALNKLAKRQPVDAASKPKKKINRFDGYTEEEVEKYTLEDILAPDLDLVFVGINPSLMAAYRGRYYAGPGNHFYKLLHASGLVPDFVSFEQDYKLLEHKIGLTNIVGRATRSAADLKKTEIKEGATVVRKKLAIFKPKIAIFNGKCIYDVFAEKTSKSKFYFGLQPEKIGSTAVWVVPSSSARCANFPRMVDKLHFYQALKKYLSFVQGEISDVDMGEFRFEGKCKQPIASTSKAWRRKNVSAFVHGGRVVNMDTVNHDTSTEENFGVLKRGEFIVTEILGGNDGEHVENDESKRQDKIEGSSEGEEESKEEENISTAPAETRKTNNRLKRSWKQSTTSRSPAKSFGSRNNDDPIDFVNLIKKRLSDKKKDQEPEAETNETPVSKPIKEGKKLKYSNLKLNSGKKFSIDNKNKSENTREIEDQNDSIFTD